MLKLCPICGVEKDAEKGFYRSVPTGCRLCWRARVAARRNANIEQIREYDRKRSLDPIRRAAAAERHKRLSPEYKRASRKRHAARYPEKVRARTAVSNAVRDGKLIPRSCEKCGAAKTHGHHEDYTKPLDVMWLCDPCHKTRHREINAERRLAANHI